MKMGKKMNDDEFTAMGFSQTKLETDWDKYKDEVPRFYVNGEGQSIYGVLKEIDSKRNRAVFSPYITFSLDNFKAFVDQRKAEISLPLTRIVGLPPGQNLKDFVNEYNKRKAEEREAILMKGKKLIILPEEIRRR